MARYLVLGLGCLSAGTALKQRSVIGSNSNSNSGECGARLTTFPEFVQMHGREYESGSEEYKMREAKFSERADNARRHNCDSERQWKVGINYLSDWTEAELQGLLGHRSSRRSRAGAISSRPLFGAIRGRRDDVLIGPPRGAQGDDLPEVWSWANLTSIKETWNQGNCGSCWAVAATTVMRAHAEIKGLNRQFSTNQVIACTPNPNECGGQGGCTGGTAELAYEYVLRAGSVGPDDLFTAMGGSRKQCPAGTAVNTAKATDGIVGADGAEIHILPSYEVAMRGREIGMTGWTRFPENKEGPLVRALVEQGPANIAVAASSGWYYYASGVLSHSECDPKFVVNHAVVLYGFGVERRVRGPPLRYWHIKNSWGHGWGEDGSIRLARLDEEEGHCGWDNSPQEGSGCKGGPSKVWVCGSCGILYEVVAPTFAK